MAIKRLKTTAGYGLNVPLRKLILSYRASPELQQESEKLPSNCVEGAEHRGGLNGGEPLTVIFDALLKYAQGYEIAHGGKLKDDYVLGPPWLDALKGARGLLDGNGALAMFANSSGDSKSNSVLEAMFWHALKAAGYEEGDL